MAVQAVNFYKPLRRVIANSGPIIRESWAAIGIEFDDSGFTQLRQY
jgi:hypothetical protein